MLNLNTTITNHNSTIKIIILPLATEAEMKNGVAY